MITLLPHVFVGIAFCGFIALMPVPSDAQPYRRSCHFVVEVVPQGAGLEDILYSFRIYGTTPRYSRVNDLRRVIRDYGTTCLQTHWANRDADGAPPECREPTHFEMQEYPFTAMADQIRNDLCDANPGELRLTADVELFIRGERGCIERDEERGVVDPARYIVLAPNYQLTCPARDIGGFENVEPSPPAAPSHPNTRFPGNDITLIELEDAEGWQACWQACEETAACHAWTFRDAGTSGARYTGPICLLKSEVGEMVEDDCCQSGVRG
ncbi:PAN domain-containing protein [Rhodobacteraceae bacterium N5(2021)]|uniref:PAN domain-containing protein n=1 Tax=Gymnodinialimonas phycosphaerae TaxID=2841589 RepID=A0A975TYS1_9RHOB|nr:PAN domain-containing protein [Gymnodinialimonas phycosphaerae]MBY4892938.1 PAN domain-containing protein [Gymnodinialimonas phycosphaerae]